MEQSKVLLNNGDSGASARLPSSLHRENRFADGGEETFQELTRICREIASGEHKNEKCLYELTKEGTCHPLINELAESFGMMIVKMEARECFLEQTMERLKSMDRSRTQTEGRLFPEDSSPKQAPKKDANPVHILGISSHIQAIHKMIDKIADAPVNVLITGETGTGKELVAKAIHLKSRRRNNPFVALNCFAIPDSIFESEMFGIEHGVATGVLKRMGKVEQAHGGTLFLDEIGDMLLSSQGKILRIIEDRLLERVGCRKSVLVDVRFIAATNKDLKVAVAERQFREDLFYRLNVVNLHILPLRERREDIPVLANFFAIRAAKRMGRSPVTITADAMEYLTAYSWPGNVRQLENEIERSVALTYTHEITVTELSENLRSFCKQQGRPESNTSLVKNAEKILIVATLQKTGGNKSQAARELGLSREGLRKKMLRYCL
jgi:DNA-binding NtrC family response regulator